MAFLNLVDTVTKTTIVPGVVDNVFKNDPLLALLKKDGLKSWDGGPARQENFQYGVLKGGPYAIGDSRDISQRQIWTGGTVTPRFYDVAVPAYLENLKVILTGPTAAFEYLDGLLQNAALTMSGLLANAAYRHGQSVSGSDRSLHINGLDEALSDGSNNGFDGRTYANYLTVARSSVDSALNSPMTGPAASVSGAISYPILEQAYSSVTVGPEQPNLIMTTNLGLAYVKMAFQAQQRFETTDLEFGFKGVKFNGSSIMASQYCPGTRTASAADTDLGYAAVAGGETLWFLNTKYLRLYVSTDPLYGFGFTGFIPAQDNSVVVGFYKFAGNLTCQAPRLMRQLFAVTG
jgi:hypothetical protein